MVAARASGTGSPSHAKHTAGASAVMARADEDKDQEDEDEESPSSGRLEIARRTVPSERPLRRPSPRPRLCREVPVPSDV